MTKRIAKLLATALALCLLLAVIPFDTFAAEAVPSGYTAISTPEQLDQIRNNLNGKYILTANIDLTDALAKGGSLYDSKGWIAIGYFSDSNTQPFTGVLDGNGYTISGFSGKGSAGISHLIYNNQGTIKNLTISGTSNGGGAFCLINEGLIQNCHSKVTNSFTVYTSTEAKRGGIVNSNGTSGVVEYCSNQADIIGKVYSNGGSNSKSLSIGGIVGMNSGTVRKCYNTGSISLRAYIHTSGYTSGIVGTGGDGSLIENCYNAGTIRTDMDTTGYDSACNTAAAGILATMYYQHGCTIRYCYNAGNVSMYYGYHNDYLGAIAGFSANSSIKNCYYLSGSCSYPANSSTSSSIVKLTENQMRIQAASTSFDFNNIWTMGSGGYYYPVLSIGCTHSVDKIAAKPATCSADGNIQYWYCGICDKCFNSSSKTTQISKASTVIPGGHSWIEKEELDERLVPGTGIDCQSYKEYFVGCANCDAVSDTEKFTGSTTGSHQMATSWSFENDTHFHACTVANCTHRADEASCDGGTATCSAKAVCAICENAYGSTLPHTWEEEMEIESRIVPGSGSDCQTHLEFYYGCTNCDAVSDTEKFTGSGVGNHQMSTDWSFDNDTHFHACTVANCTHREDEASCDGGTATCSAKAICATCSNAYGSTLSHTWEEKEELDVRLVPGSGSDCQHAKEYYCGCTECDAVSDSEKFAGSTFGPHSMSIQWTASRPTARAAEPETHYHGCTVTGCTYKEDEALCAGGTATCSAKAVCDTCETAYGNTLPHTWEEKEELADRLVSGSGSDCQHAKEYYIGCTECDAVSDTEKFTGTTTGSHQMSTQWDSNDTQHYHSCTVANCTHAEDAEDHRWLDATCTDPKTCSVCGTTSGEALDHTPSQWLKDDDYHWKECTAEGCNEVMQKASHEDKDNTGACDTCGMTMDAAATPGTGDMDLLPLVILFFLSGTALMLLGKKKLL